LRDYEILLILPAEADEALVGTAVGRIEKVVTAAGGSIGNVDRWGRRRLAYEVRHQREGYYVVVTFRADPAVQAELERTLNIADEVIRHKVVLLPERQDSASPAPAATA
jgi:small subunit ribosomal protein S6